MIRRYCLAVSAVVLFVFSIRLVLAQRSPSEDRRVPATQDWSSVSGDLNNTRYSALTQVNTRTVKSLAGAWISEKFDDGATSRTTPVVKDGVMFTTAGTHVYALDAKSGKTVWNYDVAAGRKLKFSSGTWTGVLLPRKKGLRSRKNQAGQGDEVDGGGRRPRSSFGKLPSLCNPGGSHTRGNDAGDDPGRAASSRGPTSAEAGAGDRRQSL